MGPLTRHWRRIIRYMVFQPAARYPADPRAVFMLAFSVFVGITALALDAGPGTLNDLLPRWAVMAWGVLLVGGSALTLVGMTRQTENGVITEQVGSVMVSVTTLFYSILAFVELGDDALQPVGIIFAWGLACGVRWFQLQALLRRDYRKRIENEAVQAIERQVKINDEESTS